MNLDFRRILVALGTTSANAEFDAENASTIVARFLLFTDRDAFAKMEYRHLTVKRMSDYLDRLYRMKFLNRRRVTRIVTTRVGKKCNRGYKYIYRFSKQGLQYLDHMHNPKRAELYGQTKGDMIMLEYLRNNLLSADLKEHAAEIYFAIYGGFGSKGRYMRFPLKDHPVLALLVNKYQKMLREKDAEIRSLRAQLGYAGSGV